MHKKELCTVVDLSTCLASLFGPLIEGPGNEPFGLFVTSRHLVLKGRKTDVGKGNYNTTLQVTSMSLQEISPVDISGVTVHVVGRVRPVRYVRHGRGSLGLPAENA